MFLPLNIPPGVSRNGTARQNRGRWYDANMVRWVQGRMQPIGGWEKATPEPYSDRVSGLHGWRVQGRDYSHIGIGTASRLYALVGASETDITPDDLTVGRNEASYGDGYGVDRYNIDTYGTPRESSSSSLILGAASWSMDSFGDYLVACSTADGRVFYWDPTAGDTIAAPVPNAPTDNAAVLTTHERHLMVIGADGRRDRIAWSDREAFDSWDYSDQTGLAGYLNLKTGGVLKTGLLVGNSILVLSDTDAFEVPYLGSTLVYGSERVGDGCGIISPRAVVSTDDFAVWMGESGFFVFKGYVKNLPCAVWDWIYRDLNTGQKSLITAGHNSKFSEVWFFFPSGDSRVNNRYAVWNYREDHWSIGYFGRSAWTDEGALREPLAAGEDNWLYKHEIGYRAAGAARQSDVFAESAAIEIGDGERTMSVTSLAPDRDAENTNRLQYRFGSRYSPVSQERQYGPFKPTGDGFTDVRFSGRQLTFRVEAHEDGDWRLGSVRLDVKQRGKR